MKKWLAISLGLIVILAVILTRPSQRPSVIWPGTTRSAGLSSGSIKQLDTRCRQRVGNDGFGTASLSGTLSLKGQTGQLTVDCRLQLLPGAKLIFSDTKINTKKLVITDGIDATRPSQIIIDHSQLSGAGLQIRLRATGSVFKLERSQLDFGLSIGISIGEGDKDSLASLIVNSNNLQSTGTSSEGIVLVSTGSGVFTSNQFRLKAGDLALVMAQQCKSQHNTGPITACRGT